jgi:hypothetical protein
MDSRQDTSVLRASELRALRSEPSAPSATSHHCSGAADGRTSSGTETQSAPGPDLEEAVSVEMFLPQNVVAIGFI